MNSPMNESPTLTPAFERVTETPGIPLTPEAADMTYTRYHVAAARARGLRVLELGCGAGHGLGLLATKALTVTGGDLSWPLLRSAKEQYRTRIPLVRLSAETLPFQDGAFDAVFCFEATYYVPSMEAAFAEIARVLSADGIAMFVNANPERPDFIRSPYSVHYHTADEFRDALSALGFAVEVEGAFPAREEHGRRSFVAERVVPTARRAMETLGLVPKTLQGRALIKRMLYGRRLVSLPSELPAGFAAEAPRYPLAAGRAPSYKVIYVTATRGRSRATSSM
jgi:SAM-dependent methyltransferase